MPLYRIKQFMWAAKSLLDDVDIEYVNKYLNTEERKLFNQLRKTDQQHCIRVCKTAIDLSKDKDIDLKVVGKAALLHDIGKGEYGLNIFEKSVMVIMDKVSKGKLKKYNKFKQVDSYYNHPSKGADMLKEFNIYDKEFIDTIKYHHDRNVNKNKLLNIIRESDNKN